MSDGDDALMAGISAAYLKRYPLLNEMSAKLERHTRDVLAGLEHIDRIGFRVKAVTSFAKKAVDRNDAGELRYSEPHEEIEDQIAGRILVFFRRDIHVVAERLLKSLNRVEQIRKAPRSHDAFAYESEHLVLIIPPYAQPAGWAQLELKPNTFEVQIRTLFMHAWAEPQHDLAYKGTVPLVEDEKRRLAWAASSAWGGDEIFEQVLNSVALRSRS